MKLRQVSREKSQKMLGSADSLALISSYGADWHEADLIFHEKGDASFKAEMEYIAHIIGGVAKGGMNLFKFSFIPLRIS